MTQILKYLKENELNEKYGRIFFNTEKLAIKKC